MNLTCLLTILSTTIVLGLVMWGADELWLITDPRIYGFADDSQLSKSMFVSDIQTDKRSMLCCIADVKPWCRHRGLKLNADKSEVLWLGTRQQIAKLSPADNVLSTGTLSNRLQDLVTRATSA